MAMRGKEREAGVYEFPYVKPPQRSTWEAIRTGLYDPKNGTVLGRNGKNWGRLIIFYLLFYAVLAALFSICLKVVMSTIDERAPKWQQDNGLIGKNPGLGFRPISDRTEEGSLIWYDSRNDTSIRKWIALTDDFLEPYKRSKAGQNVIECSQSKRPMDGQVCDIDLEKFGPCSPSAGYGFKTSSPCIFLKLNRIYGWDPEYYDDVDTLPAEMPDDLVDAIRRENDRKQVWVSCVGEHPADKEVLTSFNYYPKRGFESFFYPYTNANGYLSPLVAVQIVKPRQNVLINIECRAWAKNVNYRGGNRAREGSVHFELMRDHLDPARN